MHKNVFDLPEISRAEYNMLDRSELSISRLETMQGMISGNSLEHILSCLQANMELLHIKAKNYHWNVSGAGFQGVHGMFDELEDYARQVGDRIAERMRYHCVKVDATAANYLSHAWFSEGNADLDMDGMLSDMCMTLMCIIEKMDEFDGDLATYPVDQSMLQEINEGLGKYCYFVKSNMSHSSGDVSH